MEINRMFNIESIAFVRMYGNDSLLTPIYRLKYQPDKLWVNFVFPVEIGIERSTNTITVVSLSKDTGFIPKTTLGKKLLALRKKAIARGMKLLNEDEILEELRHRRGEGYADVC